jgi:hypothetical protein
VQQTEFARIAYTISNRLQVVLAFYEDQEHSAAFRALCHCEDLITQLYVLIKLDARDRLVGPEDMEGGPGPKVWP